MLNLPRPLQKEFLEFCELNTDRMAFLQNWLEQREILFKIVDTGSFRHILITPGGRESYSNGSRKKILIAHYDRVPGTPGANDNSASVFQLLLLAEELRKRGQRHNCLIVLSDGEELEGQSGLKEQGAYLLGEKLKEWSFHDSLIVVLDLCGRGDTLVHCSSFHRAMAEISYDSGIAAPLLELIHRYSRGVNLSQEKFFSDDLGLIAQAFPTLLISLIPWAERKFLEQGNLPPAWQDQHSMEDRPERLEGRSFRIMSAFLRGLSDLQLPLHSK